MRGPGFNACYKPTRKFTFNNTAVLEHEIHNHASARKSEMRSEHTDEQIAFYNVITSGLA